MNKNELFSQCKGIQCITKKMGGLNHLLFYKFFPDGGEFGVPDNIYIEITSTSTKGTIGLLVDIEFVCDKHTNEIQMCDVTYILKCDGRKQLSRINSRYVKILENHNGITKFVRNLKKYNKPKLKNPVNRFGQELNKGDWIIGMAKPTRRGKLEIGRVSRWTASNIWIVPYGSELDNKEKELQIDGFKNTFLLPNEDHLEVLTMAKLKGML